MLTRQRFETKESWLAHTPLLIEFTPREEPCAQQKTPRSLSNTRTNVIEEAIINKCPTYTISISNLKSTHFVLHMRYIIKKSIIFAGNRLSKQLTLPANELHIQQNTKNDDALISFYKQLPAREKYGYWRWFYPFLCAPATAASANRVIRVVRLLGWFELVEDCFDN